MEDVRMVMCRIDSNYSEVQATCSHDKSVHSCYIEDRVESRNEHHDGYCEGKKIRRRWKTFGHCVLDQPKN